MADGHHEARYPSAILEEEKILSAVCGFVLFVSGIKRFLIIHVGQ